MSGGHPFNMIIAKATQPPSPEDWPRLADLYDKYDVADVFFGYFDGLAAKKI